MYRSLYLFQIIFLHCLLLSSVVMGKEQWTSLVFYVKNRGSIMIPLTCISNLLILFVLLIKPRWRNKSSTVYMSLMAIMDTVAIALRTTEVSMHSVILILTTFSSLYTVWLLMALVTERVILVVYPFHSQTLLSVKTAAIVSAVIGACVATFSVISVLMVYGNANQLGIPKENHYVVLIFVGIFYSFLPSFLLLVSAIIIVIKIWRNVREGLQESEQLEQITKMAFVLAVFFIIFNCPINIFLIVTGGYSEYSEVINPDVPTELIIGIVFYFFAEVYHIFNIILCIAASKAFREDFRSVWLCKKL